MLEQVDTDEAKRFNNQSFGLTKYDLFRIGGCLDHPVRIAACKRILERGVRVSLRDVCDDLGFDYGEHLSDSESFGNPAVTYHLTTLKNGGLLGSRGHFKFNLWWFLDAQKQAARQFLDTIDPYLTYDQLPKLGKIAAAKKSKRKEFDSSIMHLSLSETAQVIGSVLCPTRYEVSKALISSSSGRLFLDQIRRAVGVDKDANGSPGLSYHLKLLKQIKLLGRRMEGRNSVYYLIDSRVTQLVQDLLNLEDSSNEV